MRIFQPTISGSTNTTGSLVITGSLRVSEGITGSLFGTSSWAVSASRAISASFGPNIGNTNLTLTGNRKLNLNNYILSFDHTGDNEFNTYFNSLGINTTGSITAREAHIYGRNSDNPGMIYMFEAVNNGTSSIRLTAPTSLTNDVIFTLPSNTGSGDNYVLRDDGTGILYFTNQVPTASLAITSSIASRNLLTASVSLNTITFTKGDGSTFNLTIDTGSGGGGGVTINNNVDNYIVTATGTANTLNGESGLTYNGVNLVISGGLITSGTLVISGTLEATNIKTSRASSGIGRYSINSELADTFWTDSSASLSSGSIVYYKYDVNSGSLWRDALADTGSGIYKLGVVTISQSQDEILTRGTINVKTDLDGLGAKPGDILYLSPTTAGGVTNLVPTGSGQIARVLGYVFDPTRRTMIFDPSSTWIEL